MDGSNIDAFCASLDRLAAPLDFSRDGLGARILDRQALRILDRAAREQGTEGRWKANRGEYGERKRTKGLPVGVGLRPSSDPMLNPDNIRGDRDITPDSASMACRGEVAGHFSAERPFYGITPGDAKAIRSDCEAAVNRALKGR